MKVKKSNWYVVISLGLAAVAAALIVQSVSASKHEVQVVETVSKLPAYTPITTADVKLVSVPAKAVPVDLTNKTDAYQKLSEVVGKYTSEPLEPNSFVRKSSIVTGVDRPAGVLAEKAKGAAMVLLSVPLQKTDLGSGVTPGDHINVVGITKQGQSVSEIKVQDVEVIKIEQGDKNNSSQGPDLWIAVPANQSDDINKAIVTGTIRCELLPKGENAQ